MHAQSFLTLCNHMDWSPWGFSVHEIFLAKKLQQVAISFSRASSQPRDWTSISHVSCIAAVLYHWTTREAPHSLHLCIYSSQVLSWGYCWKQAGSKTLKPPPTILWLEKCCYQFSGVPESYLSHNKWNLERKPTYAWLWGHRLNK